MLGLIAVPAALFLLGVLLLQESLRWLLCRLHRPLVRTLCSEGHDFGVGCSTFVNWTANMPVGATFLSLLNGIGHAATFWLHAALNLLFVLVIALWVPEARGVTLEQIEARLMAGRRLRDIGCRRQLVRRDGHEPVAGEQAAPSMRHA